MLDFASYDPGPGPSFLSGFKWFLLLILLLNLEPNEKHGAVETVLIIIASGPSCSFFCLLKSVFP